MQYSFVNPEKFSSLDIKNERGTQSQRFYQWPEAGVAVVLEVPGVLRAVDCLVLWRIVLLDQNMARGAAVLNDIKFPTVIYHISIQTLYARHSFRDNGQNSTVKICVLWDWQIENSKIFYMI